MSKKFILPILILSVFFGCTKKSNDTTGDSQTTTVDISKFVHTLFNEFPEPITYEAFFNPDGSFSRQNNDHYENQIPGYGIYEYDSMNRLEIIKYYESDDTYWSNISYEYNSSNQLAKVIDNAAQSLPLTTVFTHNGNAISMFQEETGKTGSFTFDGSGKLIGTTHDSGPSIVTSEEISYDNSDRVIEIRTSLNSFPYNVITFEYDDMINPFYQAYSGNSLIYFTRELFDMDFSGYANYFSPNNVTKITVTGANARVDTVAFVYNSAGYPTNATTTRNGVIRNTLTFEYY